jgi:hypothetical protein
MTLRSPQGLGILTVQQGGHARFYAPGHWQQVHDYDESQFPTAASRFHHELATPLAAH